MSFILYAMLTQTSAAKLFIGGVIPGLILIVAFCFAIWCVCKINPKLGPKGPKFGLKDRLKSLVGIIAYMVAGMGGVNAMKTFKGLIPFIIAYLAIIALICVFPSLCTWLPNLM